MRVRVRVKIRVGVRVRVSSFEREAYMMDTVAA